MIDEGQHAASVDAWLQRSAKDLPPAALLQLFERAMGALWARTVITLGEVTMTAIADRVLHNASLKLPLFASLKVGSGGVQFRQLRATPGGFVTDGELMGGVRFVLVEFLTVLGNLTAEILTADLHADLSRVEPMDAVRGETGARRAPSEPSSQERGQEGKGKDRS